MLSDQRMPVMLVNQLPEGTEYWKDVLLVGRGRLVAPGWPSR